MWAAFMSCHIKWYPSTAFVIWFQVDQFSSTAFLFCYFQYEQICIFNYNPPQTVSENWTKTGLIYKCMQIFSIYSIFRGGSAENFQKFWIFRVRGLSLRGRNFFRWMLLNPRFLLGKGYPVSFILINHLTR